MRPAARAASETRSISPRLSSVTRAPASTARRTSAASLAEPFTEMSSRVDPGGQRGVELARPERVAAQPLRVQDAAKRERQVGLERREQRDRALGPAVGERRGDAARVPAELILRHGVDRRPEPARQLDGVALLDPQPALADREAVVDAARGGGHRGQSTGPREGRRLGQSVLDGGHAPMCSHAAAAARAPCSSAAGGAGAGEQRCDDAGDQRVPRAQRVDDPGGHGGLLEDGAVREHQASVLAAPDDRRARSAAYGIAGQVGRLGGARARAPTGTPPRAAGRGRGTAPCAAGGRRRTRVALPPRRRDSSASTISPGPVACTHDRVFRNSTASSDGRNVALTPSTSESKTRSPSGVTVIVVRPVRPGATATWRMSIPRARPCARTNRPSSSSPTAPT